MKKINYTKHAREKLKERNIDKTNIKETIEYPDRSLNNINGTKIVHKIYDKKLLRVIYRDEENHYLVITAYYTKKERYEVK